MNENLKQRVVGVVVLVALAIIAWPLLMGPANERYVVIESDIPPRPETEPFVIPEPARPEGLPEVGSWQQKVAEELVEEKPAPAVVTESTAPAIPPEKSAQATVAAEPQVGLDSMDLPQAWMVQVGSFGQQANADKLVEALRKGGYKVYSKPPGHDATNLTKVYVGPLVDKTAAMETARRIREQFKQFKLEPKVSQFVP